MSRGTSVGGYAPGPKPNQDRDLSLVNAAYVRAYKKTLLHAVEAESGRRLQPSAPHPRLSLSVTLPLNLALALALALTLTRSSGDYKRLLSAYVRQVVG